MGDTDPPCFLNLGLNHTSDFQVIPFSNSEIKNYLSGYKDVYNTYAKVIASDDERITTVPLAS